MALELTNTIEVLNQGDNIEITDTTVYGGANLDRNDVKVYFLVENMRNSPPANITPDYDPETVESILATIPNDGWYKITMTVIANVGDYQDQLVKDYLVSERFCICKAHFAKKVFSKKCGCENPTQIQELYCLEAQLAGVLDLVAENDMQSADQAIERMNLECALLNEDCGCH
jgi:hypothetical protein